MTTSNQLRRISDHCPECENEWTECTCWCKRCGLAVCDCQIGDDDEVEPTSLEGPFLPDDEA